MVLSVLTFLLLFFFFSSRRRHTRCLSDWSSDVCSSDLSDARRKVPPRLDSGRDTAARQRHPRRHESRRAAARPRRAVGAIRRLDRSEERRVGKECKSRWSTVHVRRKKRKKRKRECIYTI